MTERLVRIYPLFERFWHWSQALLILTLFASGLRILGVLQSIPFAVAGLGLVGAGIVLLVLWGFPIYSHHPTGTWRHYVPTTNGLLKMARFYSYGILKGEAHPYRKAYWRKHNPLQALTYLALKIFLFPAIWITGLLYLTYNLWGADAGRAAWLPLVANLHALVGFAIASFVIVHVYLLTVGGALRAHVKPMLTGFDKVDLTAAEEAYLAQDEPGRLGAG